MKADYRPEIDGLRAIAVLSVIIYHAGFVVGGVRLLPGGFLGVDVFFVISGYLITGILMAEDRQGWQAILHFYERRARRILPALFLVIASCLPFAWWLMTPPQMENFSSSLMATALYVSNFFFWMDTGYFSEAIELKPLAHTWSLAVEEQFYLLFPALLLLARGRIGDRALMVLFAVGFVASLVLAHWMSTRSSASFYLLPTRAWELLAGSMLVLIERTRPRPAKGVVAAVAGVVSLLVILASFSLVDAGSRHPGFVTLPLILATMALIWFCGARGPARVMLQWQPMVAVGLISYSLYLWHHPVLSFARLYSINDLAQVERLALVGLSMALAYVSWRFVERPFRVRNLIKAPVIWVTAAGATLAAVMFANAGIRELGWPDRMPPEYARLASIGRGYWNLAGEDCFKQHCIVGEGVPSIAVTGDSHSGMLAKSFDRALAGTGRAAWIVANGDIYVSSYPESYSSDIGSLNEVLDANKAIILAPEIKTVVYSARAAARISNLVFDNGEGGVEQNPSPFTGRSAEAREEVKAAIGEGILELLNAGKRVVLVYPVPEVGWHVPNTLTKVFTRGGTPITTSEARYRERTADVFDVYDSIGEHPNLLRVYPEDIFCSVHEVGRCIVFDDNQVLYLDAQHLSVAGADRLVAEILRTATQRWGGL
jgi:Predicted acyltransferases